MSNKLPGRPRADINYDEVIQLVDLGHDWTFIANRFGVCRKTIRRWCIANNFVKLGNADFSDDELDIVVRNFLVDHPNIGLVYTMAHIHSSTNYRPTRERVQQSIERVDPEGLENRRNVSQRKIIRRIYDVMGPHHLWHMDGHHKLIRYGLITHGCIDGFSRYITYLRIADSNHSSRPLQFFRDAIDEIDFIPYRMRGDKGGENVQVADFMIHHRGFDSFMCSPSKFNTRIERLWREVRRVVIQFYMDLFKSMERDGMSIGDDIHMYVLQFMFMSRIQQDLERFRYMFNHHKISSENNFSPIQLMEIYKDNLPPPVNIDINEYGVDNDIRQEDGNDDNIAQVELHPLKCPLTPGQLAYFQSQQIQPLTLDDSNDSLMDKYKYVLNFVYDVIGTVV